MKKLHPLILKNREIIARTDPNYIDPKKAPERFFNLVDRNIILMMYNLLAQSDKDLESDFDSAINGDSKCHFDQMAFRLMSRRVAIVTRQIYRNTITRIRATIVTTLWNVIFFPIDTKQAKLKAIEQWNAMKLASQKYNVHLTLTDTGKWTGKPKEIKQSSVQECDKRWLHNHKTTECHCKKKYFEKKPKNAKGNQPQRKQQCACEKRNHRGKKINWKIPGKTKRIQVYMDAYDEVWHDTVTIPVYADCDEPTFYDP